MSTRAEPLVVACALAMALGCAADPAASAVTDPIAPAPPSAGEAPTGQVYGSAPDTDRPLVPLASLIADPASFDQQVVRTEGEVAQVCQRMGCWMELRDGADGPAVRVPMAGHAFFLPRDAAGRHATVEGRVSLRALSPDERAHLESEGARATSSTLALEASGVILHP